MTTIKTLKKESQYKFREKGSLFLSQGFPAETIDAAEEILERIRKKYYDATHNCYAFKIADGNFRYSDDGEPSGTAGIRILNAINHFDLTNIIVIVTRYFGGVKLGVGLLGKAYYNGAYELLRNSEIKELNLFLRTSLKYNYKHSSSVHHLLSKYEAVIEDNIFTSKPEIIFSLPALNYEQFKSDLESHFPPQNDGKRPIELTERLEKIYK
ncbi:IMPACT family protein [Melioribacter sp. OK-6-Me]|uniref:IMPACT family protein n=1 Tax=unclassified Melioribacter TaxID=2627329 RepID=UPI003EDAD61B